MKGHPLFITLHLLINKLLVTISLKHFFLLAPFQFICFATASEKILDSMFHVTFFAFCPPTAPRTEI
uniref:Uncharacterized protein n=1 Tax=Paramormyrops kingsleyae TaxID=1676925 RepID=A0A3B3QX47_9TELE